ncbi:MAG: hypothetical protein B1H11_00675 [Desulfobacteraceae bacterium 4484_190.1]|nr:MAG: hypothetical protein B1H11_00675 [Desulfobacteraceae bacterium 4484_190.1]
MTPDKKNTQRFKSILDVAAKIFREKGYHHANISDIAKGAGLLKGSLYYYVSSKQELLYEVVMGGLDLYIASLRKIFTSIQPPDVLLKEAIIAHMDPMDIEFDMVHVFINETTNLTDRYRKQVDNETNRYKKLWIEILEKGKKHGIFRADLDTKITLFSILGMCNWTMRWYVPSGKYQMRELAKIYAKTILNGIKVKS